MTLTQGTTTIASATADAAGGYVFANVANGTYTATPARTGFSFGPTSQTVVVSNADTVVANFVASQATWSVTGTITPAVSGNGATVTLNQGTQTVATASANSAGGYVFTNSRKQHFHGDSCENGIRLQPDGADCRRQRSRRHGTGFHGDTAHVEPLGVDYTGVVGQRHARDTEWRSHNDRRFVRRLRVHWARQRDIHGQSEQSRVHLYTRAAVRHDQRRQCDQERQTSLLKAPQAHSSTPI